MERTLLRVYDRDDACSLIGKCYFLVLPGTWDELSDYDFECCIQSICQMSWQRYTSYAVGVADISEDEMYWSEIMNYEMYEVKIDISRVRDLKKYRLHQMFTGIQ